jgi:hypothetical protein
MSDDDLWPPEEPVPPSPDEPAAEEPPADLDMTQPITGSSPTGEPSSPAGPPAPGPQNPYASGPQNPYASGPQQPYGAPQSPYAPPPNPYPQPGSFDQYATPQPYAPGYPPAYGMPAQDHPSSGLALGLGITGLVGIVFCQLLLFAAPFAWVIGGRAVREIDAQPGRYGGRDKAQAGRVMGIIGTVVLALGLLAIVVIVVVAVAAGTSEPSPAQPVHSFQNG